MLTKWKHTRTSVEYTSTSNKNDKENSAKLPVPPGVIIGAQLFRPMACYDSFYQERSNVSSTSRDNKKRRKINCDCDAAGSIPLGVHSEPIICLVSPHRVMLIGTDAASSADGNLVESKSRIYFTTPGPGSRFSLCGNHRTVLSGMLSPGAQYDPMSNLIYAIRNNGTEVAIWTAAPSSTLPRPDNKGNEGVTNGRNVDIVGGKEEDHRTNMMPKKTRKPQSMQQQQESNLIESRPSKDAIISQRLNIPGGLLAMTLTPFTIPQISSPKEQGMLAVVGAAGCCEDGSIFVIVCFPPNLHFQLLLVEGSSMATTASVVNSRKGRKTLAKAHTILASHVCGKVSYRVTSCAKDNRPPLLLSIHSVFLLEDEKSQVAFRSHQVRIYNKESSERQLSVLVEKFTMENILKLESSKSDITVKLDSNSLLIIHRSIVDRWMVTLVKIFPSEGASVKLTRTFPLPYDGKCTAANVVSFGKVGFNIVAVLLKYQRTNKMETSVLSLRIIDFCRMAEISALHWIEGDDAQIMEARDFTVDKIMNDPHYSKQCHAMITNEFDGSIALLMSPKGAEGSLDIIVSKLEMNLMKTSSVPTIPRSTSLAFALNYKAGLASKPTEAISSKVKKTRAKSNLSKAFSSELVKMNTWRSVVDNAVDKACKLLASSSKDLIDLIMKCSASENGLITNHTCLKRSKARQNNGCSISWREVYQECGMLIAEAKEAHLHHNSVMRDGVKPDTNTHTRLNSGMTGELPKRFIEVAFKETATILLLLHKEATLMKAQKAFRKPIQECMYILIEVLQTNLISAREDYGVGVLCHEHVLLLILQACSNISLSDIGVGTVGKLHVLNAMLEHVRDIPEGALVSFIRFLLINIKAEDAVAFYTTTSQSSRKITNLSNQYRELSVGQKDCQTNIGTRLLAEVLLDFTSKIVTYSYCNHFFLTKALLANVNASVEVETILLILAKLLKSGSTCNIQKGKDESTKNHHLNHASLSLGTIHWISALIDAHIDTILKTMNDGGLVTVRVKSAIHAAMVQSDFAYEIRGISDLIMFGEAASEVTKSCTAQPSSCETAIAAYSIEALVF